MSHGDTLREGMLTGEDGAATASRYLTFGLAGEEYAIDLLRVHEIVRRLPITRVPGMPSCVLGVSNLRGRVVPVLDVRLRLGIGAAAELPDQCVIFVRDDRHIVGLLVDAVRDVASLGADPTAMSAEAGRPLAECVLGIAHRPDHLTILLDVDRLLDGTRATSAAGAGG